MWRIEEMNRRINEDMKRTEKKLKKDIRFTAEEVKNLVDCNEVDRIEGGNRRWLRTITSIVSYAGNYYRVRWQQGLTENIENEFMDQDAKKVIQKEKAIVVKEWVNVE